MRERSVEGWSGARARSRMARGLSAEGFGFAFVAPRSQGRCDVTGKGRDHGAFVADEAAAHGEGVEGGEDRTVPLAADAPVDLD